MTPREKRYMRRNNIKRIEEQKNEREIRYKKRNLMRIEEDKKNSNNKDKIDEIYKYFISKYQEYYQTCELLDKAVKATPNCKRLNIGEKLNLLKNKVFGNVKYNTDNYEKFIKNLISDTDRFKNNDLEELKKANPKKYRFIVSHGNPTSYYKTVPPGRILIIFTPLGRFGFFRNTINILEIIRKSEFYNEFLNNILCYNKNDLDNIFSNCIIFFPGQKYNEIELTKLTDKDIEGYLNMKKSSIYDFSIDDKDIISEQNSDLVDDKMFSNLGISKSQLSDTLVSGLNFVFCCRSGQSHILKLSNFFLHDNINFYSNVKKYEKFISILNKSIFFTNDDEKFNSCDLITSNIILALAPSVPLNLKEVDYYSGNNRNNRYKSYISFYKTKYQPLLNNQSQQLGTNNNSTSLSQIIRIDYIKEIIEFLKTDNPETSMNLENLYKKLLTIIDVSGDNINIYTKNLYMDYKTNNITVKKIVKIVIDILISCMFYEQVFIKKEIFFSFLYKFDFKYNLYFNNLKLDTKNLGNFISLFNYEYLKIIDINNEKELNLPEKETLYLLDNIYLNNNKINFFEMYDDYEQNTGDYKLFTDFLSLCKYNLHFSQNNFELIPEKKKIILKLIDNNKITILENYNSIGSFFSLLELYSIGLPNITVPFWDVLFFVPS